MSAAVVAGTMIRIVADPNRAAWQPTAHNHMFIYLNVTRLVGMLPFCGYPYIPSACLRRARSTVSSAVASAFRTWRASGAKRSLITSGGWSNGLQRKTRTKKSGSRTSGTLWMYALVHRVSSVSLPSCLCLLSCSVHILSRCRSIGVQQLQRVESACSFAPQRPQTSSEKVRQVYGEG